MTPNEEQALSQLSLAMKLLDRAAEALGERPPDSEWFRDYFRLTGDHMLLGEEGWEPASLYDEQPKLKAEMLETDYFIDEVNAPEGKAFLTK